MPGLGRNTLSIYAYAALFALFCWTSSAHAQDVCWRQSSVRDVGTIPNKCGGGKTYDDGLCYDGCKSGYRNGGPMCWQACPAGKTEIGPVCSKGLGESCPSNMLEMGLTCGRKAYGRGVGTLPDRCGSGEEYDAGLCYDKCPGNRTGVGFVCWQNTCPADYPVSCGMGCATSTKACAQSIFEQTTSTLEVVQNAVGAGKILNTARKTAKYVGREAAKAYIKTELKKAARKHGSKMKTEIILQSSEFVLGKLDDGSGQFDIAAIDPTGIVAVVQAFNKPICGDGSPKAKGPTLAQITAKSRGLVLNGDIPQPKIEQPVYVTTDNAPGKCLSKDAKNRPVMVDCAPDKMLVFDRLEAIKDHKVYLIRDSNSKRCLYSNADGRFAFAGCNPRYNDQRWYTARTPKKGHFLLLNGNSGKCLFLNKKKLGTYTCNPKYNDQLWQTQAAAELPQLEPIDIFTSSSQACIGAAPGATRPGTCGRDSAHVASPKTYKNMLAYKLRQLSSGECLKDRGGKLVYATCTSDDSMTWYPLPSRGGTTRLANAATKRCLQSNVDGRHGTAPCSVKFQDQQVVIKRHHRPADRLQPRAAWPRDGEWVRLGTKNMPKRCLTAKSSKRSPFNGKCDYDTSGFDVEQVRVGVVYAVRFKHRETRLCLTQKEKWTLTAQPCREGDSTQWWTSKPQSGTGGFMIQSLSTSHCLFMNKKKAGISKCNASYSDQIWRVME